MKWMPSHLNDAHKRKKLKEPIPEWVAERHIYGNHLADVRAEQAATYSQVDAEIAKPILDRILQLKLIQKRLSAVGLGWKHTNRKHVQKKPFAAQPTLEMRVLASKHTIVYNDKQTGLCCTACYCSIARTHKANMHAFLAAPCAPTCDKFRTVTIGTNISHCTHPLIQYGGVYMCKRCGATATKSMKLLAKPCGAPGIAGERNKDAFKNNKRLPGYPNWPYKASTIPFVQSSFADAGDDKQILTEILRSVATHSAQLDLPIDVASPEEDDEGDDASQVEEDFVESGSSDSD